jgi:hypothetical protein
MKNYLILAIICIALGIGGTELWEWKCNRIESKPDLGKPGKPTHGTYPAINIIPKPSKDIIPYGGYIIIEPKLNATRDSLFIHAYNDYTFTDQSWPIKCNPVRDSSNSLILMPMVSGALSWDNVLKKITPGYGGQLVVGYTWGPVGLSAAPGFLKFPSHIDFIVSAGAVLKIKL